MNHYELLVDYADQLGLEVIEKDFKSSAKGLCKGNRIGISKSLENIEKRCVLAEEMAHSLLTVGDILDTRSYESMRQEMIARRAAYEFLVPLPDLVAAYFECQGNFYDIPDILGVTEEFLQNTIDHYSRKYNGMIRRGNYIVYFSPFVICEVSSNKLVIA